MSATIIDGYVFASSRGAIVLRHRTATRFSTSTAVDAGVQINPSIGVPFTLDLVKYTPAVQGQSTVDYHKARIGRLVFLESNGIRYWQGPYNLRFLVLDVQIVESKAIVRACGTIEDTPFDYSPAWMVASRWTLQPVGR